MCNRGAEPWKDLAGRYGGGVEILRRHLTGTLLVASVATSAAAALSLLAGLAHSAALVCSLLCGTLAYEWVGAKIHKRAMEAASQLAAQAGIDMGGASRLPDTIADFNEGEPLGPCERAGLWTSVMCVYGAQITVTAFIHGTLGDMLRSVCASDAERCAALASLVAGVTLVAMNAVWRWILQLVAMCLRPRYQRLSGRHETAMTFVVRLLNYAGAAWAREAGAMDPMAAAEYWVMLAVVDCVLGGTVNILLLRLSFWWSKHSPHWCCGTQVPPALPVHYGRPSFDPPFEMCRLMCRCTLLFAGLSSLFYGTGGLWLTPDPVHCLLFLVGVPMALLDALFIRHKLGKVCRPTAILCEPQPFWAWGAAWGTSSLCGLGLCFWAVSVG